MTEVDVVPNASRRLERLAGEVLGLALEAHARFDRTVWQVSPEARVALSSGMVAPSYHNEHHIRSVTDCALAVFRNAETGPDPFRLREHLSRWNASAPPIEWDELRWATHLAFSCHDLGNIAASGEVTTDGRGRPSIVLRGAYDSSVLYDVPQVEIRSAEIADELLARLLPDAPLLARVAPAVRHLVLQTVFHFEKTESPEPFWLMMQTVDMIGSYFFSPQRRCEALAGLFAEMRVQKPGEVTVLGFLSSLEERFKKLLPDAEDRKAVLAVFETNPHGWTASRVLGIPERYRPFREPVSHAEAIRILLE